MNVEPSLLLSTEQNVLLWCSVISCIVIRYCLKSLCLVLQLNIAGAKWNLQKVTYFSEYMRKILCWRQRCYITYDNPFHILHLLKLDVKLWFSTSPSRLYVSEEAIICLEICTNMGGNVKVGDHKLQWQYWVPLCIPGQGQVPKIITPYLSKVGWCMHMRHSRPLITRHPCMITDTNDSALPTLFFITKLQLLYGAGGI